MTPTFLIIGSAKCGTTSLAAALGQHPEIFACRRECHFFSVDQVYSRGFEWYESLFDGVTQQVRGEKSPTYSVGRLFPLTPARIKAYQPEMKLIYIVREPLARIESAWLHLSARREGNVGDSFDRAVFDNRELLVDSANYWDELTRYRALFDDRQILILFFEDFVSHFDTVLQDCFTFLSVSLQPLPARPLHLNWSRMPRPQWRLSTRAWVDSQLHEGTARLLEHCRKPRDYWTSRRSGM